MLREKEIIELWQSETYFREIAATEIVRDFKHHAFLFFQLIQSSAEPLCAIAKNEMPFLRKGFSRPVLYKKQQTFLLFQDWHDQQTLFFEKLNHYIREHKQESKSLISLLINLFEGISEDLRQQYHFPIHHTNQNELTHKQLMVFVTGKCNLHCPYCFSANIEPIQIHPKQLNQIFRWADLQGISSITPCGGEPLLYSHFQLFLDLIKQYQMTTYFASNLTIDISKYHSFEADIIKGIYIHLTPEIFKRKELQRIVIKNIETSKKKQIELVGRVNITEGINPINHWIKFLSDMSIKRLHIALTIPSSQATNMYIPYKAFHSYIPIIEELIHKADYNNICIGFSKPIPLCLFPYQTAHRLIKIGYDITTCDIYKNQYLHNICLSPSLQFTPCLGLTYPQIQFNESLTWEKLEKSYKPFISNLLNSPPYIICKSCFLWSRRLCQGICLSYKEKK